MEVNEAGATSPRYANDRNAWGHSRRVKQTRRIMKMCLIFLARAFWHELEPAIDEGSLYEVALQETEKNSVIYRGEDES